MKTFFAPKDEEKYHVVEDYGTASAVASLIQAIGWIGVILAVMVGASALSNTYGGLESKIEIIGVMVGSAVAGLVVVAVGQITRAIVDIARNAGAILRRLERGD